MNTIVYVPFSPRSFTGICEDVRRVYPGCRIVALVLEDEFNSCGHADCVGVSEKGNAGLVAISRKDRRIVVCNGGPTPLCVAAVRLAKRIGAKLVNVQRDGITDMEEDAAADECSHNWLGGYCDLCGAMSGD